MRVCVGGCVLTRGEGEYLGLQGAEEMADGRSFHVILHTNGVERILVTCDAGTALLKYDGPTGEERRDVSVRAQRVRERCCECG